MKFYRYDIDYYSPDPEVCLKEFVSEKETPKGYWIRPLVGGYFGIREKWIPKVSRKRYAYPTKEEALESFILRKKRQIQYLKNQLYFAEETKRIAEEMRNKND